MVVHTFCHAVAGNPPLIGDALLDPVRLFISGKIHTEDQELAPQEDLILSQADIQLTASDICKQYLSDTFLRPGKYDLFFDPVCILPGDRQLQKIQLLLPAVNRDLALYIFCQLLVPQTLSSNLHLRHHSQA